MIKKILLAVLVLVGLVIIIQLVNAAKYKMLVNVVDGENVLGVNPLTDNLDFGDLSRNNGMTRYVAMKNDGKTEIFVAAFKIGEISDLVKINKNFFLLKPSGEVKLAYEMQIPPSAQTKKYSGWTIIFRFPKFF